VAVTSATIASIKVVCLSPNFQHPGTVGVTNGDLTCIPTGAGLQLDCTATATYTDTSTGDITATAAWASSAAGTASTGGLVTLNGGTQQYEAFTINATAGSANITATQAGVTSNSLTTSAVAETLNLTANPFSGSGGVVGPLDILDATGAVSPGQTIFAGTTSQFQVVANYTPTGTCTAQESEFYVTPLAVWSTVAPTVATVSNAAGSKGLVTAVAAGSTSLSATFAGQAGTFSLTVGGSCLQSLTVAQDGTTYPENVEIPLTVNAVFSGSANPVALTPATASTYIQAGIGSTGPAQPTFVFNNNALFMNTGATAGATTVTLTAKNGVSCTGTVKATPKFTVDTTTLPTALAITPAALTGIPEGTQETYTATASYGAPYNTSYNVSQNAVWTTVPATTAITYAKDLNSPNELQNDTLTASGNYTVNASFRNVTATATEAFSVQKTITGISINGATVGAPSTTTYASYGAAGIPGDLPITFTTTVTYSDGTTSNNVTGTSFASSNTAILPNPSAAGVATTITPAAQSTTNVTASITDPTNNKIWTSPSFPVVVNTATVNGLSYNPPSPYNMPEGTSQALAITANYSNGQSAPVSALVTSSSPDTTVVSVATTATGTQLTSKTTANSETLTIIFNGFTSSFKVNVTNTVCITALTVSPSTNPSVPFGGTQAFTVLETKSDGTTADATSTATWSDSTTNANIVNNGGGSFSVPKTGATAGAYTVTATLSGAGTVCAGGNTGTTTVSNSAPVTVTSATVVSIAAYIQDGVGGNNQDSAANLPLGTSRSIQVIATLSNTFTQDVTANSTFVSGDPTNVTVSAAGVVTGAHAGAAGINVTYSPNTAITTTLSVNVAACNTPQITIAPAGAVNVAVGYTQNFTATAAYPATGACSTFNTNNLAFNVTTLANWTATPAADATIGANTGVLNGVAAGTVTVKATYASGTASNPNVNVVAETLTGITINNGANISVPLGGTANIPVSFTWNPPCAACTTPISFGEGTPGIVAINPTTYVLTGSKVGSTTVNASSGTTTSNVITATVSNACVTSLSIATTPGSGTTIPVGVPVIGSITCQNSDGSACSNTSYTVQQTNLNGSLGTFYDFSSGTTAGTVGKITATLTTANGACGTGISTSASFTAGNATLSSIAISPSGATVQVGSTQAYQSEGTYTGTTGAGTYDISDVATLTSTNTPIATVNGDLATGVAQGSTNISAAYQGVNSAEIPLTVSDTNPALTSLVVTAAPNSTTKCPSATAACAATSAAYLAGGYTLPLFATGTYADGTTKDLTTSVTWALGTWPGTAGAGPTINGATGVLTTGTGAGIQPVTASIKIGTTTTTSTVFDVTVDAGTVTGAKIVTATGAAEPATINVADNATVQLESTATTGADTYWTTTNFAWASSNANVGSVSNGLYTALAATGTTNVSASKTTGGATITAGPQVIDDTNATPKTAVCSITSLGTTAGAPTLAAVGDTVQLYVTVTYSDGSVQDQTGTATTQTNNGHVTVKQPGGANPGLATAQSAGTTTVTPVVTGLTGTSTPCTVTVQ
jgi:hypothetical protein